MTPPEISYIVLSYNYEDYIGQAIRSILGQTHQNFEIVVVDDASTDRSCEIVEAFADPRIRLLRNPTNIGGAASYNRAVSAAHGTWLSNLDADDWIAPDKSRTQLDAVAGRPNVAVVGSFVNFVNPDGSPMANAGPHEAEVNVARDLNVLDHWIGRNCLCRSSTLVRQAAHLEVGLDDVTMTRAPDYELWTRFLLEDHAILLVPQRLTYYRLHSRGITYGDPAGTFTEMCWILLRNLKPRAQRLGASRTLDDIHRWVGTNSRRFDLDERVCERILGLFLEEGRPDTYAQFREATKQSDPRREAAGREFLATVPLKPNERASLLRRGTQRGRRLIARSCDWLERRIHFRS